MSFEYMLWTTLTKIMFRKKDYAFSLPKGYKWMHFELSTKKKLIESTCLKPLMGWAIFVFIFDWINGNVGSDTISRLTKLNVGLD